MFKIDSSMFLTKYAEAFGQVNDSLSDALRGLVNRINSDVRFIDSQVDRRKLAYILATFKWETGHTMRPIDEKGSSDYFNKRYGPATSAGKIVGNVHEGDGAKYHGRGYVQLTGLTNYKRASAATSQDLVNNPELAKDPINAYHIAIQGMIDGWFTGKRLANYINDAGTDYTGARKIINGTDKAADIAGLAFKFDTILKTSQIV